MEAAGIEPALPESQSGGFPLADAPTTGIIRILRSKGKPRAKRRHRERMMDSTRALAERLRTSAHWRDAALVVEIEAEIGGKRGTSAKDLLAVRLERAFAEVFSRKKRGTYAERSAN